MSNETNGKIDKLSLKLILPECRLSYPHLFKPNEMPGSAPKFSMEGLIPKNQSLVGIDGNGKECSIQELLIRAKTAKWGDKSKWPTPMKSPISDGDKAKPGKEIRPEAKGCWKIKCSTGVDNRPVLLGKDRRTMINDPADLYPGCYVYASVFAHAYNHPTGGPGVTFILDGVMKSRDGDSFGSRKSAAEMFAPLGEAPDEEDDSNLGNEAEEEADFT